MKIHKMLESELPAYSRWHKNPAHTLFHFAFLVIVSAFWASTIYSSALSFYDEQIASAQFAASIQALNNPPHWSEGSDFIANGKHKPSAKIVEVRVSYNIESSPAIKIKSVQIKNGFVPKIIEPGSYSLELIDQDGSVISKQSFAINTVVNDPPPQSSEDKIRNPLKLSKLDVIVVIPFLQDSKSVNVVDKNGNIIASASLSEVPTIDNKPNFRSIKGDEMKKSKNYTNSSAISGIIPQAKALAEKIIASEAKAQTSASTLDITFIGQDYSSSTLATFHTDVNTFSSFLLTVEPFKSRASQIAFHYVDNTNDITCAYRDPSMVRLLYCTDGGSSARQTIINAGAPIDNVIVLVSTSTYGGSGGPISVSYTGSQGPLVFVHEIGHTLGDLIDEYLLNWTMPINTANCYSGTIPFSNWTNLAGSADYTLGCDYSTWYRSSPSSVMLSLSYPFFNAVSQKMLNKGIDLYSGRFSDTSLPISSITSPLDGSTLTGTVTVNSSNTDNNGIAYVQLWKDCTLYATSYKSPFSISWNTTGEIAGPHSLQTRSYDVSGNVGLSQIISVTAGTASGTPPTTCNTPENDTTPPSVSISSPTNNATLSGTVTISANATDNVGVENVRFILDGNYLGGELTASPYNYSWNTNSASNGNHTLAVVAKDALGNSATSTSITITVKNVDTTSPTIRIDSPTNGSIIKGSTATISASASDLSGISSITLFLNDSAVNSCTNTSSCSYTWNTSGYSNGTYKISASAKDASANSNVASTSASVTLQIKNACTKNSPSITISPSSQTSSNKSALAYTISIKNNDSSRCLESRFNLSAITPSGWSINLPSTLISLIPGNSNLSNVTLTPATDTPDGIYSFTVQAVDTADSAHKALASANYVLSASSTADMTIPTVSITSPSNGATLKGNTVTISSSASDSSGIRSIVIAVDNNQLKTCLGANSCSVSLPLKSLSSGTHIIKATATDASSNSNVANTSITVTH